MQPLVSKPYSSTRTLRSLLELMDLRLEVQDHTTLPMRVKDPRVNLTLTASKKNRFT
jgi:hypothetical protein